VRLISLGARLEADGDRRIGEVFFAQRDAKEVLVLRKEWTFAEGDAPRNGHELAQLFASSRVSFAALAKRELVTRAARRRANGLLDLSAARGMKSSMLPGRVAWDALPETLLVRDLAAHEASVRDRPPAALRPRRRGDGVRVVVVHRVADVSYFAAEQEIVGIVEDLAGTRLVVRAHHRTVSPGAIAAVRDGLEDGPRFVSGELRKTSRGWETTPLAIVGEHVRVPDIERPGGDVEAHAATPEPRDELGALLDAVDEVVERGVHKGVASVRARAQELGGRLREAGLVRIAELVAGVATGDASRLVDLAVVSATIHETPRYARTNG
jgi:hypothetical protein